jgi:hypothetical protein
MNEEFRRSYKATEREAYWTMPRLASAAVVLAIFLVAAGLAIAMLTAPMNVARETLRTDNIINNYEWFHDASQQFTARTRQVAERQTWLAGEGEAGEKNRLRIELGAISQSCRELAARYNANAMKSNRSLFMGRNVPTNLDAGLCQ